MDSIGKKVPYGTIKISEICGYPMRYNSLNHNTPRVDCSNHLLVQVFCVYYKHYDNRHVCIVDTHSSGDCLK